VDRPVLRDIGDEVALDFVRAPAGDALGQGLHITLGRLGNPGAGRQHGHLDLSLGISDGRTLGRFHGQVYLIKIA
jgi:hypothetical protein